MAVSKIVLQGECNVYTYYPNDSKSILKAKGELNSSFVGTNDKGERVVIKKLNSQLKDQLHALRRFKRELKACSELEVGQSRPEIIQQAESLYLIRRFVSGISLKDLLVSSYSNKISPVFTAKCLLSLLNTLGLIHQKGIVHCDIKPENIIVEQNALADHPDSENPQVHLIDFGLAEFVSTPRHKWERKLPFSMIFGAPEQMLNLKELINPTTDLFSAGVTFYYLLNRKSPYPVSHPLKLLQLQLVHPLPSTKRIPEDLFSIMNRLTVKPLLTKPPHLYTKNELLSLVKESQAKRYQSVDEVVIDLTKFLCK